MLCMHSSGHGPCAPCACKKTAGQRSWVVAEISDLYETCAVLYQTALAQSHVSISVLTLLYIAILYVYCVRSPLPGAWDTNLF